MAALAAWGVADFLSIKPVRINGALRALVYSQLFGLPLLLAFGLLNGFALPNAHGFFLALAAGAFCGAGYAFFFKSLETGRASVVTTVAAASGLLTALLAILFLGDVLGTAGYAGLLLLFAGVVLASLKPDAGKRPALHSGMLPALGALLSWGIGFYLLKLLADSAGAGAAFFWSSLAGLLFVAAFALLSRADLRPPKHAPNLAAVAALGLIGNYAYLAGVSVDLVSLVAPVSSAYPAVTILLAHFLLRERLVAGQYAGIAFILSGVILLSI